MASSAKDASPLQRATLDRARREPDSPMQRLCHPAADPIAPKTPMPSHLPSLVFGLGRSGHAVLRALHRHQRPALWFDDHPRPEDLAQTAAQGAPPWDPNAARRPLHAVYAAPGVPLDHPLLNTLRDQGATISGEADLAAELASTPVIGITGTAGKTSVTRFVTHLLQACGVQALAGGNIDPPLVDVIEEAQVAVAELSSFQLERTHLLHPRVAVLLNLGVDHVDRHGSVEAYHHAKLRLLQHLTRDDVLVLPEQDPLVHTLAHRCPAARVTFAAGTSARETNLNAARAASTAFLRLHGITFAEPTLDDAIASAPEVSGRFQSLGALGHLEVFEDSIATRGIAVEAALRAAASPCAWILGGVDKGADLHALRATVAERVGLLIALGRDGAAMVQAYQDLAPHVVIAATEGEHALRDALSAVMRHPAAPTLRSIVLAPLAASFDQFPHYQARAEAFRKVVREAQAQRGL